MKKALLLLLLASSVNAAGPIYPHDDPTDQREYQEIYAGIKKAQNNVGVTDGSDAKAGAVGEYVSSTTTNVIPAAATPQYKNIVQITLSPGDWDISAGFDFVQAGATISEVAFAVSKFSGNTTTDHTTSDNSGEASLPTAAFDSSAAVSTWRQNVTVTTIIYAKAAFGYSAGTPAARARISARRIR